MTRRRGPPRSDSEWRRLGHTSLRGTAPIDGLAVLGVAGSGAGVFERNVTRSFCGILGRNQTQTIVRHAAKFSYAPVAVWITLRPLKLWEITAHKSNAAGYGVTLQVFSTG